MSTVIDEKKIAQTKLLNLVKLRYRLEHAGSLADFEKETNDQIEPPMDMFLFNDEETVMAYKFKDELMLSHIQKLPQDILVALVYNGSICSYTHIYQDKLYIQHNLIDWKWDHKAAQKVIETFDMDTLHRKIEQQIRNVKNSLIIYPHAWHVDSEELKPYM